MKFVLFVEGYTEDKALPQFLKRWLDNKLTHSVGIKTVCFKGWSELIKDAPLKAKMHLHGPKSSEIIAVISLLDLYGPTFYAKQLVTPDEKYREAKHTIERTVNQPRFFQFFAVHEIEAWLLSEPEIFPAKIQNALPPKSKAPESVNNNEPPGKLLERLYPLHLQCKYGKIVHGKTLFGKLNPDIAYNKCPYLQAMLDKMLELAQAASHS
jgi:hypothetical protein